MSALSGRVVSIFSLYCVMREALRYSEYCTLNLCDLWLFKTTWPLCKKDTCSVYSLKYCWVCLNIQFQLQTGSKGEAKQSIFLIVFKALLHSEFMAKLYIFKFSEEEFIGFKFVLHFRSYGELANKLISLPQYSMLLILKQLIQILW